MDRSRVGKGGADAIQSLGHAPSSYRFTRQGKVSTGHQHELGGAVPDNYKVLARARTCRLWTVEIVTNGGVASTIFVAGPSASRPSMMGMPRRSDIRLKQSLTRTCRTPDDPFTRSGVGNAGLETDGLGMDAT